MSGQNARNRKQEKLRGTNPAVQCAVQSLESRRMFAMVNWDGGPSGEGTNFLDPVNWANDALPLAADTAVIGATGANPTITLSGTPAVQTITSSRNLRMTGGTLSGGTLAFSGGAALLASNSGGTLSNIAITGDVLLNTNDARVTLAGNTSFTSARMSASNVTLGMAPGYTLDSPVVSEGAAGGNRSISLAGGTVTFGPSAVVRTAAGSVGQLFISISQISTLLNNGLITAESASQQIVIQPSALTNNGTLQVTAGTMTVQPSNWTNSGTVTGTGGTFNLGGTLNATAGIGTFTTSALTVNAFGTITNTGNTFNLNAATGSWNLAGGTINNGAIVESAGAALRATSSGGTLSNVAITGDLLLNTQDARVTVSGTTSFTAARMSASNVTLGMAAGYTLNSLVVSEGTAGGNRAINLTTGGSTVTFGPSAVVRSAAGSVGQLLISNSNTATLVNNGLITNEAAGQHISIAPSTLTNNGTLQLAAAGAMTVQSTNWTNTGTVTGTAGTLNLGGNFNTATGIGTFTTSAVAVNVGGTITNTGGTIALNAATGSWRLTGGTINNGSIVATAGANVLASSAGGTLSSVAITGDVLLNSQDARLTLTGNTTFTTARLSASNVTLSLVPGYTLNSVVVSEGAAGGNRAVTLSSGTVTFGPAAVVRTAAGSVGQMLINQSNIATLVNNGLISAESASQQILLQPANLTNTGTLSASNGARLAVSANIGANSGQVRADGLGSVLSIANGTYAINQPSMTTNNGLVFFAGTPTKAANFNASGRFVLDYTGAATPLAQVKADVISGYAGGAWNGAGINSTAAAVTPRTAVGYGEASNVLSVSGGTFAGVGVDGTSVLVRYTLAGDANIDGTVNIGDFARLAAKFNQSGIWTDGDSNYDGVVNISDFSLLASNFNQTLATELPRTIPAVTAIASSPVATPMSKSAAFGNVRIGSDVLHIIA